MNIESTQVGSSPPVAATPNSAKAAQPLRPIQQSSIQDVKKQQDLTNEPAVLNSIDLNDAVSKISNFVSNISSEIAFSIDETSGQRVVKVLDSQSKEVIRQIPSEDAIQLAQALDKLQGLFIKDKA